MKKIQIVIVVLFLCISGSILANRTNTIDPSGNLSTQIQVLLKDNPFQLAENELIAAKIRFTINKEGEIVVLSVYTENDVLEGFVKGRLNYKKVTVGNVVEGKIYTVPVKITA
ncbi:MAG: hypothetical protein AAF348_15465 [Bacteroidota bacterium]